MENESQTTTESIPSYVDIPTYSKTYDVFLDHPTGYITGTITCSEDDPILEQLEYINTYQAQTIELLQQEIEIQQQIYTVTSYLFAAVIGFALIKLFTSFFNSVITF